MVNAYEKSARAVRHMRRVIFDYPADREAQADRVLRYLIRRKVRGYAPAPVGPYSGLTAAELRASRTYETDWF